MGGRGVTEQERLRWMVDRLLEAHREALEVCNAALDTPAEDFEEWEARALREEERARAALADVRGILVGASDDVHGPLLGGGTE